MRGDVTKSPKTGVSVTQKKDLCPPKFFFLKKKKKKTNFEVINMALVLGDSSVGTPPVCKISLSFRFRMSLSDMTNYKSAYF